MVLRKVWARFIAHGDRGCTGWTGKISVQPSGGKPYARKKL